MLVVHPHFHPRRTGITAHVDLIVPALSKAFEARVMGSMVSAELPRVSIGEVLARAAKEPVIWHAHRNNELLTGLLLRALRPNLRVVATSHSGWQPGRYSRFLFRRANALVTLNDVSAEWVRAPSRVVHHGVDLERFSPPSSREEAFTRLGLPGVRGIGVIGRLRLEKGQADFVEAFAPLASRVPEWTPAFIGLTKPEDAAYTQQLQLRLPSLVLPGEQRDIVRWYQGLSIVVQPSHVEAFSMVTLEAMACGACVIASALPQMASVIEHDRTGLLFTPKDAADLRRQLERALTEPGLIERLGRAAREAALARFGVAQEAQALAELYQAVASQPRLPA